MDTKPTEVSPVEKVEEPQEVPAPCDQGRIAAPPSPSDMGKDDKWQSTMRKEVRIVMNLDWFITRGLISLYDYTNATLKA
jgi:hypothetical protein